MNAWARVEPTTCTRRGFALPLALFTLTVIALLAALLLQGAVQELRIARGDIAGARAQAAAGSALADALAVSPDSAVLALPRGTTSVALVTAGADTTRVAIQTLGHRLVRISATARAWSGGVRADAGTLGFVRVVPDPAGPPGSLRYERLPGWWWAPIP
jgi:Tfp pilus assembly protein PilX